MLYDTIKLKAQDRGNSASVSGLIAIRQPKIARNPRAYLAIFLAQHCTMNVVCWTAPVLSPMFSCYSYTVSSVRPEGERILTRSENFPKALYHLHESSCLCLYCTR